MSWSAERSAPGARSTASDESREGPRRRELGACSSELAAPAPGARLSPDRVGRQLLVVLQVEEPAGELVDLVLGLLVAEHQLPVALARLQVDAHDARALLLALL